MSQVISTDLSILGGTPVFAGTRVPVVSLFDALRHGRSIEYFLEDFPSVTREQVESLLDQAQAKTLADAAER